MEVYGIEVSKKRIVKIILKKLPPFFYQLFFGSSFKKVFWIIGLFFFGILLLLSKLEVVIDKTFWTSFLENILPDIGIFFVAIFVIDYLFKRENKDRFKQINKQKSEFIVIFINKIVFQILKYLELASIEDLAKDGGREDIDLNWASERLNGYLVSGKIEDLFFEKYLKSDDPQKFVEEFIKLVTDFATSLNESLEKIYPHPIAEAQRMSTEFFELGGTLSVLGIIPAEFKKETEKAGKVFGQDQFILLSKLSYFHSHTILRISRNLLEIRDMALKNRLFFEL